MAGNLDFLLNLRANTRGLDDIRTSTSQLVQSFYDATRALAGVSDASDINAENLEQMAAHGQAAINQMNGELRVAQLELNRLAATNATPQDIENARNRGIFGRYDIIVGGVTYLHSQIFVRSQNKKLANKNRCSYNKDTRQTHVRRNIHAKLHLPSIH